MINFLIALDVILAILIIASVFLHRGSDGFIGESTPTTATGPRFETYDKIIAGFVLTFFLVTLSINYLVLYQHRGTADIDAIVDKVNIQKNIKKIDTKNSEKKTEAPLAE